MLILKLIKGTDFVASYELLDYKKCDYKDLLTFPHHKHTEDQVVESRVVSLEDVLTQIKGLFKG